jgi:tetratricopeptide (TPR) repeat protein
LDLDSSHGRALADSFRVQAVPTFVMLTGNGDCIERTTGYRSRRILLRDLARFREGHGTLDNLKRRLADRPDDPLLRLEIGLRHDDRQEFAAAIEQISTGLAAMNEPVASSSRPSSSLIPTASDTIMAEASRALAQIHRRQGRSHQAVPYLERLLEFWPAHPYPRVTWQLLAECFHETGQAEAAAEALMQAASILPRRADLLDAFAAAAADLRWNLDRAEAAARQAVSMTDRNESLYMATLAQVLRQRRRYPEALLWIKRAEAASPEDSRWRKQRKDILRAAIEGN